MQKRFLNFQKPFFMLKYNTFGEMYMNRVILIGRLTRDPELRYTSSNRAVCQFSVAIDRPFTNQASGQREADFIKSSQAVVRDIPAQPAVPYFIIVVADILPLFRGKMAKRRKIAAVLPAHFFHFFERPIDFRTFHFAILLIFCGEGKLARWKAA